MLRAFWPSRGLAQDGSLPAICARWRGHRIEPEHLRAFLALTGLATTDGLPVLYPHVLAFPLQMVVLTERAFPLPIWGALQVRNELRQRWPLDAARTVDLDARVAGHRVVDKGTEIDLHTRLHAGADLAWESVTTFYYRGRGPGGAALPAAAQPAPPGDAVARWRTPRGIGWRVARLTGDYNGIHYSRRYARLLGFRDALHHPQIVIGQCLAHLPQPAAGSQRLDVWLKGPVYYASDVTLRAGREGDATVFALVPDGETRPAILGRWTSGGEPRLPAK